jgi:hypothetical protein
LHYIPNIAHLMLDEHVFRGDGIEIAMPHPECWPDLHRWIYTNEGEPTPEMLETFVFLSGGYDTFPEPWQSQTDPVHGRVDNPQKP